MFKIDLTCWVIEQMFIKNVKLEGDYVAFVNFEVFLSEQRVTMENIKPHKTLSNFVDGIVDHFQYGDFRPRDTEVFAAKFSNIICTDNGYWKKLELPPGWTKNYKAIYTADPHDNGLQIFFIISPIYIEAIVHEGIEFGQISGEKYRTKISLLDVFFDHSKFARWFEAIVYQCIQFNYSDGKFEINLKEIPYALKS